MDTVSIVGLVTLLLSGVGVGMMTVHAMFFRGSSDPLARHVRDVFITDAVLYCTTLFLGLLLFMGVGRDQFTALLAVRTVVIAANIWMAYRLYRHIRNVR